MLNSKRIILILFLMIYIAISGCSIKSSKCHLKENDKDPISIEISNILEREYINKNILDKNK